MQHPDRYLVTGARGMLGRALMAELGRRGLEAVGVDREQGDLTDPALPATLVERHAPGWIVHCAAYTAVDRAEAEPERARTVNVEASARLARAQALRGGGLTLLSSDYVFDGQPGDPPFREEDPPRPRGAYARSKAEAEKAVLANHPHAQVVRSAWLFGPGGHNFVRSIREKLEAGENLRVVADQTGNPTYTTDLAAALVDLAATRADGIFHLTNSGKASWYELARHTADLLGHDPARIMPVTSAEWQAPAPRPAWSVLANHRAAALGIAPLRPWQEALAEWLAGGDAD